MAPALHAAGQMKTKTMKHVVSKGGMRTASKTWIGLINGLRNKTPNGLRKTQNIHFLFVIIATSE